MLAGIGLLLRHRWARWRMILLMAGLVVLGVKEPFAPVLANPTAGAPKRIVLIQSVALITVGSLVLLGFFSRPVRREFAAMRATTAPGALPQQAEGWWVGHQGRDRMFYEENRVGIWQRIEIDGEMLTGRAHHVIYFTSAETWQGYPAWARERREEVIVRIKSRFREPDYEYHGGGTVPRSIAPPLQMVPSPQPPSGSRCKA